MERKTTIATVAAAAGILVAGSAAGVAVVNAAASGTTPSVDDTALVAVPAAAPASVPALPAIPVVPAAPEAPSAQAPASEAKATVALATTEETAEVAPKSATPTPETTTAPVLLIDKAQATAAVLASTGGTVQSVSSETHAGLAAFAVTVKRSDGSVVTGFVDKSSGVVYDWRVDQAAPKPVYNDDDHEEDDDREYHDDKDHDDQDDDDHEEHDEDEDDD